MKRVVIVHGIGGSPDKDFLPWAKEELQKRGYEVVVPAMPDQDHPKIETWVPYLKEVVGAPRETDILIGHSVGCQTVLRYLESLPDGQKVDRVILIAGWFSVTNLDEEESAVLQPWLDAPLDLDKVKLHADSFVAIFSDNDPFVPLEENEQSSSPSGNKKLFEDKLGAKVLVEHNKGHFNEMPQERPDLLKYF